LKNVAANVVPNLTANALLRSLLTNFVVRFFCLRRYINEHFLSVIRTDAQFLCDS